MNVRDIIYTQCTFRHRTPSAIACVTPPMDDAPRSTPTLAHKTAVVLMYLAHIIAHPIPYIALSTFFFTWYQSALLSANSYTSSARKMP